MRTARFLLAAALAAVAGLTPLAGRAAQSQKPNFVVILIDDMGYGDIGPFGSKLNRTPQPRPHGRARA